MEGYIKRLAKTHGVLPTEFIDTPSSTDLFYPPHNSKSYPLREYQRIIGGLIYCLKIRHDVRKEVIYLATRTSCPTESDYKKARRVLVYLNSTSTYGPTFYTTEGAVLSAHADASYAVHTDGRSQSGYYCSIGRYSAPVCCYTGAQNSCVSLSSMSSEYVCLAECGKKIVHLRQLLADVGFEQKEPTVIYEDNQSAIDLAVAPQIPRKSRHILVRHHYIRDLVATKIVTIKHLGTDQMVADLLTKPVSALKYIPFRNALLNRRFYSPIIRKPSVIGQL